MKYHPKHVEQLIDVDKLYSVASCWIIIAIIFKSVTEFVYSVTVTIDKMYLLGI